MRISIDFKTDSSVKKGKRKAPSQSSVESAIDEALEDRQAWEKANRMAPASTQNLFPSNTFSRILSRAPVNKSARIVTDQAGITDSVEFNSHELHERLRSINLDVRRRLAEGQSERDVASLKRLARLTARQFMRTVGDNAYPFRVLKVGDKFDIVCKHTGAFIKEDTVRSVKPMSFRGSGKCHFSTQTGIGSGWNYKARLKPENSNA